MESQVDPHGSGERGRRGAAALLGGALLVLLMAVLLAAASPHPTPTCPAGERYVAGRFTGCVPNDLTPSASCAPGQRYVAGSVYPNGVCYP